MRMTLENRHVLLSLCIGLPGAVVGATAIWHLPISVYPRLLLLALLAACVAGSALYVRASLQRRLQAIYTLTETLRGGDFRMRMRVDAHDPELGRVHASLNHLADALQQERLRNEETRRMLGAVLSKIETTIVVFDQNLRLRTANAFGFRLLDTTPETAIGRHASDFGLDGFLGTVGGSVVEHAFPAATGVWRITVERHIERDRTILLLFVDDVRSVLRAEEISAWKKLTRVLSHEVNNSLAPIASVSASLQDMMAGIAMPADTREDVDTALEMILGRSNHLRGFIQRYAEVTRLPRPMRSLEDLRVILRELPLGHGVDRRLTMRLPDEALMLFVDRAQIEQVLINLLENAEQASVCPDSPILLECSHAGGLCRIRIVDEGHGISNPANLFVPFYSTRAQGNGIGLVLSRQIAEAHEGSLILRNRSEGRGCVAELTLPIPLFARDEAAERVPAASRAPERVD